MADETDMSSLVGQTVVSVNQDGGWLDLTGIEIRFDDDQVLTVVNAFDDGALVINISLQGAPE